LTTLTRVDRPAWTDPATVLAAPARPRRSPAEWRALAREAQALRLEGWSYRQIGQRLGVGKGQAHRWINRPALGRAPGAGRPNRGPRPASPAEWERFGVG
jgi:hypothetical protein